MNIEQYLEIIKSIQESILEYLDKEDDIEEYYQNIIQLFIGHNILEKIHEIRLIFHLLSEISDNHHRYSGFFNKIEKIILYFKDKIQENFTNSEIFEYFESNKRILLFLIEEKILIVDSDITNRLIYLKYSQYFNPEIKSFKENGKRLHYNTDFFDENEADIESSDNYKETVELDPTSEESSQETDGEDRDLDASEDSFKEESENEQNPNENNFNEAILDQNDDENQENTEINEIEENNESNDNKESELTNQNQIENTEKNVENEENNENFDNKETNNFNENVISKESNVIESKNDQSDENDEFEMNRKIGENHNYICQLIQKDLIEDFITYATKNDLELKCYIPLSIFETNSFLINKRPTLIEYAAFFGSIQIFKYLYLNGCKLTQSLWTYSIHGDDAEIIRILEEHKIKPKDEKYEECYEESIKCHHNHIINYIESNYLSKQSKNHFDLYSYWYKHYDFALIPSKLNEDSLYDLIEYDFYTLIELLLKQKKININKQIKIIDDKYYKKPYHHREFLKFTYKTPALIIAIQRRNVEIVKLILSHPNINANVKSCEIIQSYSKNNPDVYKKEGNAIIKEKSALLVAAEKREIEIIKLLLANPKINVNDKSISKYGYKTKEKTVLNYAVLENENEIVKILLENKNIDVNIKYIYNNNTTLEQSEVTSLNMAVNNGNIEIIKLLLSNQNIDVNCRSKYISMNGTVETEKTPLYDAVSGFDNNEIIKLLLENKNIDVNVESFKTFNNLKIKTIKTPLYKAVEYDDACLVNLLLSNPKINVNIKSITTTIGSNLISEKTPLFKAIQSCNIKIVSLLLSNPKINVNKKSIYNENKEKAPLHIAVIMKRLKVIKLLLENEKINVNVKDEKHKLPIEYADDKQIISLLKKKNYK